MKARIEIYFFLLLSFIIPYNAFGLIGFEDAVTPELVTSGRAKAMGNAFLSKVDDSLAAFYNPAGLGSVRNSHLHLSNFQIEANKGWMNMATKGKVTDASSNFFKSFDLEGIRQLLLLNRGKMSHSKFSLMPNFTTRYFSAGYFITRQHRATIGGEASALYEFAQRTDHGPYGSFNFSFLGGVFKVGATAMLLSRNEIIGEQDRNTVFEESSVGVNKGIGLFVTSGVKLTLPWKMLPTFSCAVHNAGDADFTVRSGSTPTRIERSVGFGFSLTPQIGKTTRMHFEINYKDLAGAYKGVSGARKTAIGLEFDFFRTMFVRFGYGDGYGSAGLGVKSQKLEFDITTYAVDTTTSEYRGEEDRRFSLTISSGL